MGYQYIYTQWPQLRRPVPTSGGEGLAIGTKTHLLNLIAMAFKRGDQAAIELPQLRRAAIELPQLRRPVTTSGGEGLAIRTKTHRQNLSAMAFKRGDQAAIELPQLRRPVTTSGGEGLAIGTKTHVPKPNRYGRQAC